MKQSCVSAFARVARFIALAAVVVGFGAATLHAQSTGKIEGRVRDQAGAPIQNAQVVIDGTAFNALTNPQGYWFINNVPAGTVVLRATFIGYKGTQVSNVRILAGQTTTQDIQLESSPVQIVELTVIAATTPLVPRDEVTTKQRVDGSITEKLPVDRIGTVLQLQPGVSANNSGAISIRGGRTDEAATYVDGVPVTPGNRGGGFQSSANMSNGLEIGTNQFEEASVTTGASSAEFGNAQSGIISIVTKTGGSSYEGRLAYETDEPFGVKSSLGFNRVEGNFSGPLFAKNFTFALGAAIEGQKSAAAGRGSLAFPIFVQAGIDTTVAVPSAVNSPTADTTLVDVYNYAVYRGECESFSGSANADIANNYGVDCQGTHIPGSGSSVYQLSGRLNYSFGSCSRISFSALASQDQGRITSYNNLYNPQSLTGRRSNNRVYTLNWNQQLTKSTERALALDVYLSYQQDRFLQSPLTRESEANSRDPFGGFMVSPLDFLFDFDNFPLNQELVDNYRSNKLGTRRSPYELENTAQYALVDIYRNNAYGVEGFSESGGPTARLFMNRENRWLGRANLDWQFDRYNRLKFGGEVVRYQIDNYSHTLNSQAFSDIYMERPTRSNAYIEDRLDLGDVVLVAGMRYDYYWSRASRPAEFPRISTKPGFDPANPTSGYVADQSHSYMSPHVQVAFPVTDRTNFRLSYAHQVQAPDFGLVLGGINTDLAITNTNHVYGSDLDFGKTITFEFGIRHSFNDDMVLDMSAYNRDNLSNAAGRLVSLADPFTGRNQDIRMMTNADFGNTRGIDLRLDRRFGNLFNGTLSYSFAQAKNTGTDPFTYINFGSRVLNQISGGNAPPPQAIAPTANSRPHSLTGAFSMAFPGDWKDGTTIGSIFQDLSVFAIFRYQSGTAYTGCEAGGNESVTSGGVCSRGGFTGGLNANRLPTFKSLDMRFTKGFGIGGLDLTAYLDARNILNLRNIVSVFVTTNDIVSQVEADAYFAGDSSSYAAEADRNGLLEDDGSIDLRFGGARASGCGNYVTATGTPSAPNCVSLIRAEERWGNGDGILDVEEQHAASDAAYFAYNNGGGARGESAFLGQGRRLRLGFEVNF
jgi:hypothetical protein